MAVAAMGIAPYDVGFISTFAWYQAESESVSAATTKANITTATSYDLAGVVLTVEWSNSGAFNNLALTDDNGDVWAYNGSTDNLVKANHGTKVHGAVVTVTLGLPEGLRTDQQAAIAGNYTFTITKSDDNGRLKTIDATSFQRSVQTPIKTLRLHSKLPSVLQAHGHPTIVNHLLSPMTELRRRQVTQTKILMR